MNEDMIAARAWLLAGTLLLAGCGGGSAGSDTGAVAPVADGPLTPVAEPEPEPEPEPDPVTDPADAALRTLALDRGVTGDPALNRALPTPDDPLVRLGRALFFSKALGGEEDVACVSCHHPALGGADGLSLPIGVGAVDPDVLGPDREHLSGLPNVPRNAPTVFNMGLWDRALFHDGRVESPGGTPGANGAGAPISTPDVAFGQVDPAAGAHLPAAQARFPVTSVEEMRGMTFEPGGDNDAVRAHLAARIGDYGNGAGELARNEWRALFRDAFGATASAEQLVTFDNIAAALGAYERALVLVDNPFFAFVRGDDDALTAQQKDGARLFYTPASEGGGNCFVCHAGDLFSDEDFHTVAFPQFGPGKGDGVAGDDDFGRERVTGLQADRYRFRTPSLLNVAVSAPFGHAGTYDTLAEVLRHYDDPRETVEDFFADGGACTLPQFADRPDCATLYPGARDASDAALAKLGRERDQQATPFGPLNLNGQERDALVAFLLALSDPCVDDRSCLDAFVPDPATEDPDALQLVAVDGDGIPL